MKKILIFLLIIVLCTQNISCVQKKEETENLSREKIKQTIVDYFYDDPPYEYYSIIQIKIIDKRSSYYDKERTCVEDYYNIEIEREIFGSCPQQNILRCTYYTTGRYKDDLKNINLGKSYIAAVYFNSIDVKSYEKNAYGLGGAFNCLLEIGDDGDSLTVVGGTKEYRPTEILTVSKFIEAAEKYNRGEGSELLPKS